LFSATPKLLIAGKPIAATIDTTAMTTNSSITLKAF